MAPIQHEYYHGYDDDSDDEYGHTYMPDEEQIEAHLIHAIHHNRNDKHFSEFLFEIWLYELAAAIPKNKASIPVNFEVLMFSAQTAVEAMKLYDAHLDSPFPSRSNRSTDKNRTVKVFDMYIATAPYALTPADVYLYLKDEWRVNRLFTREIGIDRTQTDPARYPTAFTLPALTQQDHDHFWKTYSKISPAFLDRFASIVHSCRQWVWAHKGSGGDNVKLSNNLWGVKKYTKEFNTQRLKDLADAEAKALVASLADEAPKASSKKSSKKAKKAKKAAAATATAPAENDPQLPSKSDTTNEQSTSVSTSSLPLEHPAPPTEEQLEMALETAIEARKDLARQLERSDARDLETRGGLASAWILQNLIVTSTVMKTFNIAEEKRRIALEKARQKAISEAKRRGQIENRIKVICGPSVDINTRQTVIRNLVEKARLAAQAQRVASKGASKTGKEKTRSTKSTASVPGPASSPASSQPSTTSTTSSKATKGSTVHAPTKDDTELIDVFLNEYVRVVARRLQPSAPGVLQYMLMGGIMGEIEPQFMASWDGSKSVRSNVNTFLDKSVETGQVTLADARTLMQYFDDLPSDRKKWTPWELGGFVAGGIGAVGMGARTYGSWGVGGDDDLDEHNPSPFSGFDLHDSDFEDEEYGSDYSEGSVPDWESVTEDEHSDNDGHSEMDSDDVPDYETATDGEDDEDEPDSSDVPDWESVSEDDDDDDDSDDDIGPVATGQAGRTAVQDKAKGTSSGHGIMGKSSSDAGSTQNKGMDEEQERRRKREMVVQANKAREAEAEKHLVQLRMATEQRRARNMAEAAAEEQKAAEERVRAKKELAERNAKVVAERIAKAKAEAERVAKAQAERDAKAQAVAESVAKAKAERAAKAEAERVAKAEAERAAKAEAERAAKAEAERVAKAEAERVARVEAERVARVEAERAARVEAERAARVEAERAAKIAAQQAVIEKAEQERLARQEAARLAREEAERFAREKAERERLARQEAVRLAKEKAERIARDKADRLAKEEANRLAREEADRLAKEEANRLARKEADRLAREKPDQLAREEAERVAKEEAERVAKEEAVRVADNAHGDVKEDLDEEQHVRDLDESPYIAADAPISSVEEITDRLLRESENKYEMMLVENAARFRNEQVTEAVKIKADLKASRNIQLKLLKDKVDAAARETGRLLALASETALAAQQVRDLQSIEAELDCRANLSRETTAADASRARQQAYSLSEEIGLDHDETVRMQKQQAAEMKIVEILIEKIRRPIEAEGEPFPVRMARENDTTVLLAADLAAEALLQAQHAQEDAENEFKREKSRLSHEIQLQAQRIQDEKNWSKRYGDMELGKVKAQHGADAAALAKARGEPVRLPNDGAVYYDWRGINVMLSLWMRPTTAPMRQMDTLVQQYDAKLRPSEDMILTRQHVLETLQLLFDIEFPGAGLQLMPFGSYVTGLGNSDSDIDICVYAEHYEPNAAHSDVVHLASILRLQGFAEVRAIPDAKVPIVKFVDPHTGIACDMNIQHPLGIYNSALIKAYLDIDARLSSFLFLLKHFAKVHGILDASSGYLCSYAFILMAIVFFQEQKEPILPRLQSKSEKPKNFDENKKRRPAAPTFGTMLMDKKVKPTFVHQDGNIVEVNYDTRTELYKSYGIMNTKSVARLLYEFFEYFARLFDYRTMEVSPMSGRFQERHVLAKERRQQLALSNFSGASTSGYASRSFPRTSAYTFDSKRQLWVSEVDKAYFQDLDSNNGLPSGAVPIPGSPEASKDSMNAAAAAAAASTRGGYQDRFGSDSFFCVMDPFLLKRNVAGTCRGTKLAKVWKCFDHAYRCLALGQFEEAFKPLPEHITGV